MDSLARLVKISTYYPQGHTVFDRAAQQFCDRLLAFNRDVELRVERNFCSVASIRLEKLTATGEEMRSLLFDMGLHRVLFHRNLTGKDLQQFFSLLMAWKMQAGGARNLMQFSGTEFPPTIEVFQQEFTASPQGKGGKGVDSGDLYGDISEICRSLVESGHDRDAVVQTRDFLLQITKEQEGEPTLGSEAEELSQEEIVSLISRLVRAAGREKREEVEQNDLQAISGIFESYRAVSGEGGHGAINLLLGLFENEAAPGKKRAAGGDPIEQTAAKSPEKLRISASQAEEDRQNEEERRQAAAGDEVLYQAQREQRQAISRFITEKALPIEALKTLARSDRGEELSILFQLYLCSEEQESAVALIRKIVEIFNRPVDERERRVSLAALVEVMERCGMEKFSPLCQGILQQLHGDGSGGGQHFLIDLIRQLKAAERPQLWPFVVNEALYAGDGDRAAFLALMHFATRISPEVAAQSMPRLQRLDAFTGRYSGKGEKPRFFLAEETALYPLYATLMETALVREIGQQAIGALQESPQDAFITPFAGFLEADRPQHLHLLYNYFKQRNDRGAVSAKLHEEGGLLLVEWLTRIEESEMDEERAAQVISHAGAIRSKEVTVMLERIATERRMGVIYLWPGRCRKAASTVLTTRDAR